MISGKSTLIAFFYLYNLLNLSMTITKVPLSLFFEKKREAQFAGGDIVSSYSRTSDWLSWKEKSLREKQKEGKRERDASFKLDKDNSNPRTTYWLGSRTSTSLEKHPPITHSLSALLVLSSTQIAEGIR